MNIVKVPPTEIGSPIAQLIRMDPAFIIIIARELIPNDIPMIRIRLLKKRIERNLRIHTSISNRSWMVTDDGRLNRNCDSHKVTREQ